MSVERINGSRTLVEAIRATLRSVLLTERAYSVPRAGSDPLPEISEIVDLAVVRIQAQLGERERDPLAYATDTWLRTVVANIRESNELGLRDATERSLFNWIDAVTEIIIDARTRRTSPLQEGKKEHDEPRGQNAAPPHRDAE